MASAYVNENLRDQLQVTSYPSPPLSSFYLTTFKGNMITRCTYDRLNSLLKSRRFYSSTVSQKLASLAGASYREEPPEPLLPGPVDGMESAIITKSELDKYFYPLFCRGWDIKRFSETDIDHFGPRHKVPLPVQSPFLVHKFRFKGNRSARAFLKEIIRIESEEKHHISFNLWSEKRPVITVMTQTHSARRFDQDTENDRVTTDGIIEPGLTLRDIRFAVLLENLLNSSSNPIARVPNSGEYCSTDRAVAWKILLSEFPFSGTGV